MLIIVSCEKNRILTTMPIKDKNYWKEYNQKRKEKGYFQQNYLQRKEVVKNGGEVVKSEVVKVVKTQENILQPDKEVVKSLQPDPVVKNESLQPKEILQPPNRSRCQELEKPINPTIELWKTRYFDLEKETNQKLKEQSETILRLKERLRNLDSDLDKSQQKLRSLANKNQAWEQKYINQENYNKNPSNLSVPDLNHLISKHTKIINGQHIYSERDRKEREFLKSLLDRLWIFN